MVRKVIYIELIDELSTVAHIVPPTQRWPAPLFTCRSGCKQQCNLQGIAYGYCITLDRTVTQRPQFLECALKVLGGEPILLESAATYKVNIR